MGALLDTTLGERDSDRTLGWGRWCISAEAGWTAGETVDNAQEANILGERRRADTLVVAVVGLVGEKSFAGSSLSSLGTEIKRILAHIKKNSTLPTTRF